MVGCSIATDKNGLITQGDFNEFASDIKYIIVELKDNKLNFALNHPNEKINPKDIFKIFQFSQSKNLDIDPSTLDIIISSKNLVGNNLARWK